MTHQFHLLDVDFSFNIPPFVLLPSAGFSNITSPEMTIETEEIVEGTDPFKHHILGKATTNTITLQRGVSAYNSDFWRWISACLMGNPITRPSVASLAAAASSFNNPVPGKRRNLILIHFTPMTPKGLLDAIKSSDTSGYEKAKGALLGAVGGSIAALSELLSGATGGFVDFGITNVPGKVYLLFDCIPTRYKPGSDFDATASEVSMEELDLNYHRFEEFSLTG